MSMEKIYRKVARKYGVSVAEVKSGIQEAINSAYQNPPEDGVTRAWQNRVARKGVIPTSDEFIRYAAGEIKKGRKHPPEAHLHPSRTSWHRWSAL